MDIDFSPIYELPLYQICVTGGLPEKGGNPKAPLFRAQWQPGAAMIAVKKQTGQNLEFPDAEVKLFADKNHFSYTNNIPSGTRLIWNFKVPFDPSLNMQLPFRDGQIARDYIHIEGITPDQLSFRFVSGEVGNYKRNRFFGGYSAAGYYTPFPDDGLELPLNVAVLEIKTGLTTPSFVLANEYYWRRYTFMYPEKTFKVNSILPSEQPFSDYWATFANQDDFESVQSLLSRQLRQYLIANNQLQFIWVGEGYISIIQQALDQESAYYLPLMFELGQEAYRAVQYSQSHYTKGTNPITII
jgi:hypothetical protein